MSALPMPHSCPEHSGMISAVTQAATISGEVRDAVTRLCTRIEAHFEGDGHPAMKQRIIQLEESRKTSDQLLQGLVQNQTVTTQALKEINECMEKSRAEQGLRFSRGTAIAAACIALGSPIITGGIALYIALNK